MQEKYISNTSLQHHITEDISSRSVIHLRHNICHCCHFLHLQQPFEIMQRTACQASQTQTCFLSTPDVHVIVTYLWQCIYFSTILNPHHIPDEQSGAIHHQILAGSRPRVYLEIYADIPPTAGPEVFSVCPSVEQPGPPLLQGGTHSLRVR